MIRTNPQRGFTLVELLLAMTFIAFLLLFIVSAILQATRLYVKGQAIRQINQSGRQVMTSLKDDLRYAKPVYVADKHRLCVSGTTYVWNTESPANPVFLNKYMSDPIGTGLSSTPLRFVSVKDPLGALCLTSDPIDPSRASDIIGASVTLLKFSLSQQGGLWQVSLILSTNGDNTAVPGPTPSGYMCNPMNEFCAFGDFTTTVYTRKG